MIYIMKNHLIKMTNKVKQPEQSREKAYKNQSYRGLSSLIVLTALLAFTGGCSSSNNTEKVLTLQSNELPNIEVAANTQDGELITNSILPTPKTKPSNIIERKILDDSNKTNVSFSSKLRRIHKVYKTRFGDSHPIKFSGGNPKHFSVHGVDVSKYQGNIDWTTIKRNGVSFGFIKATEGDDHNDVAFKKNWNAAKRAHVARGAYHFYYFCSTAKAQAKWFIRNVPKDKSALPPVLDMEWNAHSPSCKKRPSRRHILKEMATFSKIIERHYGKKPIIYTTPDFYEHNLEGAFKDHYFWLRSVKSHPKVLYGKRKWLFWQYTGTGRVKGVRGNIDLNVFNGNKSTWVKWLKKNT